MMAVWLRLSPVLYVAVGVLIGLSLSIISSPGFTSFGGGIARPNRHTNYHDAHVDEELDDEHAPMEAISFHANDSSHNHDGEKAKTDA
uniref:Secreted protein n=1 Tax=Heterorhabditis bacteriophora TaxID=37862 RepID=A0A1I7XR83_HETBA